MTRLLAPRTDARASVDERLPAGAEAMTDHDRALGSVDGNPGERYSLLFMRGPAILFVVLAVGCTEETSERPTCEPVIAVDDRRADVTEVLDVDYDGTSYCLRIDTTAMSRPHLEVSTPFDTSFLLELRDLGNVVFATGVDVRVGNSSYTSVEWDPAGGETYDILVHIQPRPPIIGGNSRVSAQLSVRP